MKAEAEVRDEPAEMAPATDSRPPAEIVTIELPRTQEVAHPALRQANEISVTDETTLAQAHDLLKALKAAESAVEARFAGPTKAAHETHKKLTSWRGQVLKPIQEAAGTLRRKMTAYQDELERARRAEAQRAADALQREREEAAEREAERLAAQGKSAEAEAVLEEAIAAPAPYVAPVIPKREGGPIFAKTWKARLVDPDAFYKALAEQPALRILAPANDSALNQQARTFKGASPIPGVEFYEDMNARA